MNQRGLAVWLCLAAWPSAAWAQRSADDLYHQSLQAYKRGQYQLALEGFMDVLMMDPSYPDAQKKLSLAGRALLEEEKLRVDQERRELLTDILRLHGETPPLEQQKAADERAWEDSFQHALELAQDRQRLHLALTAYEQALGSFPLYTRKMDVFLQAKADFYGAYQSTQWSPLKSRLSAPEAHKSFFSKQEREKANQYIPNAGSLVVHDRDEGQAAERIKVLETDIDQKLLASEAAYDRFVNGAYRESARLWERILAASPHNAEARYYLEQARAHPDDSPDAGDASEAALSAARAPALEAADADAPAHEAFPKQWPQVLRARQNKPPLPAPLSAEPAAEKPAPPLVSAQDYYMKGLRAYSVGEVDAAIQYWESSLEVDPEHPKAKKALARVLREKK